MNNIYFDNSATTKIDPRVLEKMMPYLTEVFGNPGSIHSAGQAALSAVDEARAKVADFFIARPRKLFLRPVPRKAIISLFRAWWIFLSAKVKKFILLLRPSSTHPFWRCSKNYKK